MINFENFGTLHPDGRRLTIDFLERAHHERHNAFPAFMLLWISFNGWISCVTGLERDAEMVEALGKNLLLSQAFLRLMREDGEFRHTVSRFAEWWPVFDAHRVHTTLGRNFIYEIRDREDFVARVIDNPRAC